MYIDMLYMLPQLSKSMASKQKNYRLPALTLEQIAKLRNRTGMTETQVIISAIDRMSRELLSESESTHTKGQENSTEHDT
jgi:hypothetical protein